MKNWYINRDGAERNQHRGRTLVVGKAILLTPQQAKAHNKNTDTDLVKKLDNPPKDIKECQFPQEFDKWMEQQKKVANKNKQAKNQKTNAQ